jgi:hypothetical protein
MAKHVPFWIGVFVVLAAWGLIVFAGDLVLQVFTVLIFVVACVRIVRLSRITAKNN